ncbi:MAG: terminase [Proteobacteria bacterium]|nr:terminase [Pseudomonadota bacterium]
MKKRVDEKIADALNISISEDIEKNEIEPVKKETAIEKSTTEDKEKDYRSVRCNLHSIISKGNEAIDGILEVAHEGDSPRAYEVAAQMIKTVAECNKDLLELHKKMKDLNKEETNYNSTTNNSIYVGSTKDLQELVNQTRSESKRIHNDIIDVEIIEDDQKEK